MRCLVSHWVTALSKRLADDASTPLALDDVDVGDGRAVLSVALPRCSIEADATTTHLGVVLGINAIPATTAGDVRACSVRAAAVEGSTLLHW